ncbi:unnamed protein product, partial [Tilletia caries]
FVLLHARDSIVISSANRSRIVSKLDEFSGVQHDLLSVAQKHLGLGTLGRLQRATLHPSYRDRPQLLAVEEIISQLVVALKEGVPPTNQSLAEYPDLRTDLHLGFFLRNLRPPSFPPPDTDRGVKRTQDQLTDSGRSHDADHSLDLEESACPYSPPFIHEFTPAGLAFKEIGQLRQRREQASTRLMGISLIWKSSTGANLMRSSFSMSTTSLLTLSLLFYQLQSYENADQLAEVFVTTVREEHERFPSTANRLRLCNALGFLVLIFGESDRDVEAMYAAEEALALLQPLYKDDPAQHLPLVASLKLTYSIALSRMADKELGSQTQLLLRRKACRVAHQATTLARAAHQANPTDTEATINLALALSSQGGLCRELSETCAEIKAMQAKNQASYEKHLSDKLHFNPLTLPPFLGTQYTRDKLDNWSCGDLEDAGAAYEATIEILRELAKEDPELCDPLLAETLQAAADVYNSNPKPKTELCIARYREAISIYRRLAESFPLLFNSSLELGNYDLALRLRWEGRLVEANDAFGDMLTFRPADEVDPAVPIWRSSDVRASVHHARALLCARLERYDEGLTHATTSCLLFAGVDPQFEDLTEPLAVRGFCRWASGKQNASEAQRKLKKSIVIAVHNGRHFPRRQEIREMREQDHGYFLALGWMGAVQCTLGERNEARIQGERAVELARIMLVSENVMQQAERAVEQLDFVLPHLLVLLAGTHWEAGRSEAAWDAVEESLRLGEGVKGLDGSTRKTALLLKARLLDGKGSGEEAAAVRAEAETIAFKGFLEAIGPWRYSSTLSHRPVAHASSAIR